MIDLSSSDLGRMFLRTVLVINRVQVERSVEFEALRNMELRVASQVNRRVKK